MYLLSYLPRVEITGLDQGVRVQIGEGNYALLFETGNSDNEIVWVDFTFVRQESVQAKILVSDEGINPHAPIVMEAEPAIVRSLNQE